MPEDLPTPHVLIYPQDSRGGRDCPTPWGQLILHPWGRLLLGCGAAGAVYPAIALTLLGVIMGGHWFLQGGTIKPQDLGSALRVIGAGGMFTVVGGFFGACYAMLVSLHVLVVVWLGVRLLGIKSGWPDVGAFSGGLTAFVCMFPLGYETCVGLLRFPTNFFSDLGMYLLATLLGPMLAIFCGQVGGLRAGMATDRTNPDSDGSQASAPWPKLSFSLQQMLGLTVLASLLLAALKLSGLFTGATLLLVSCWLVWQTVSRYPAAWVARRVGGVQLRLENPRGWTP